MFSMRRPSWLWTLVFAGNAWGASYAIPAAAPSGAATLSPTPVGVSFEFFAFPSYFTNVTGTNQCLANFETLTGSYPPIRIGGTTQDRAAYDASTSAYVVYSVASATDAPAALTFGPSFMTLAGTYPGSVVVGLNRGHNDITNTIAAAKIAKSNVKNLLAIELGNEPEYWLSDDQPIAESAGSWTPAIDAASQNNWDIQVGSALGSMHIIQAGNSNSAPPTCKIIGENPFSYSVVVSGEMLLSNHISGASIYSKTIRNKQLLTSPVFSGGAAELIATENDTVKSYVYDYAHHNYPGGTLTSLMSHSSISSNMEQFSADVAAARNLGREYVLGETNSVSGGGAATVSPTFGAAIWTLDYILRATLSNITRSYFHHGTLGACYYCWWGRYDMGSPYYGAYAATAALAHGSYISALDAGTSNYGVYVIYDSSSKPLRVVLINSDYYTSGTRSNQTFTLTGVTGTLKAKRLTAANALSRVDQGSNPSFGGQNFANVTCVIGGTETYESVVAAGGQAGFTVAASEALVVYLQ